MNHEATEIKTVPSLPKLYFKPEGYINVNDSEFLEQFSDYLKTQGLDPNHLLYSGTGAKTIFNNHGSLKMPDAIFAMNLPAWQNAIRRKIETPAGYAEDEEEPIIVLLNREECADVYSHDMGQASSDHSEPVNGSVSEIGNRLVNQPLDIPVEEMVAHKDFHDGKSPADACVGIAYLDLA